MLFVTRCMAFCIAAATGLSAAPAADPFAEYVRSTEPLAPEAAARTFRLPDGFEIQLFAAEPEIAKPMNMAFDERGRLWVTDSREYPFAVPLDKKGRDTIKVLEDTDGDGRADKVTTFAEGLNIPIGIYPYKGGVIAWSIPNIWHFQDTDSDGKADRQEVLFGPLGWEKDTHGMNASFRRGYDGWIYITHGFNNTSVVKGRDGSELKLNSGNTYRVRPDGSRVEAHTWGQVNPFGLTFDPLGNLYSADCHSSPIYQLIRGAIYPSFGKPDDGLGFAPVLMQHSHNSTAIGGIAYYADDQWPPDFRDNIFVGNVMTSRVNRDVLRFDGSSPSAKELPDFLTTTDPWFRPVDLQFGPDGALYVADFYNRIIGHYEVPLTHPGRDRERGRIWRVTYKGGKRPHPRFNLVGLQAEQVVAELGSPNLTRRMLAMNHLVDNVGRAAREPLRRALATSRDPFARIHSLWALHRLGALDSQMLDTAAADQHAEVRIHALRVLSESAKWTEHQRKSVVLAKLSDPDARVVRAAADALAQQPSQENARPLIAALERVPAADNHLLHTMRIALRNQLQVEGAYASLQQEPVLAERSARTVAGVSVAVPSAEAGSFLLRHVEQYSEPPAAAAKYLRHVAKYLPTDGVDRLVQLARRRFADDVDGQLTMFKSVQDGLAQRGAKLTAPAKAWGEELAVTLLKPPADDAMEWANTPVKGMKETKDPWFLQRRQCADGTNARFLCSLPPGGEHLTGILRSKRFTIPPRLTFYLAGHDGPPDKGPQGKNVVRLRGDVSDAPLMSAAPPRNDTAQKITWDLGAFAGQQGWIEVVDADTGGAYAWLAIGRFDPPAVTIPKLDPAEIAKRQQAAAELARTLRLKHLQPQLVTLLSKGHETAMAAAHAIATLAENAELDALAFLYGDESAPTVLRPRLGEAFGRPGDARRTQETITEAMRISPSRLQLKIAQGLAASSKGSETLLEFTQQRIAPPGLLQDRGVRERAVASNPALAARIDDLTKGLTPPNEAIQKLIDQRRKKFDASKPRATEGAHLFTKHCAACHQINKQGGLVGPQLDGIRNRGVERLCEDILDPNRSVDHAFRNTLLVMKDNDVVSGLLRREEGETIVLADSAGKEISVQKKQVAERRQSDTSLMPENFGELLSPEEFNDLMAFLLSH